MKKSELYEYMLNHYKIDEKCFKKRFSDCYENLCMIDFPDNFVFRQKLYHWFNDDSELKLGICPVCRNRCSFVALNYGYKKHCCKSCSTKSKETQSKRKNTCLEKYGVEHESKCNRIKNEKKKTCLKHYGVEYPQQNKKIREKTIKNNIEKFGVPYTCMLSNNGFSTDSGPNREFAELLEKHEIEYEREFFIERYYYDFKIEKYLIEINPTITHNSYRCAFSAVPKEKEYHYRKTRIAEKHGYACIHIWDWIDKDAFIKSLKNKKLSIKDNKNVCVHWYNMKTKSYIANEHDFEKMIENGYLPIYDDGHELIIG